MTSAQKYRFYFPAWTACCKANGWHMRGGMVDFDAGKLTEEGIKVFTLARQRAHSPSAIRNPQSAITLDDVRHACHILALGRDKSSAHFTNDDLDRVVALFKLLADPDDLAARMKWDAYQRGEDPGSAQRIEWFIRTSAPEAYVRAVALDMCGSREWENLAPALKRIIARALSQRRQQFHKPIEETANCPF